jgi:antitoxin HicB
MAKTIKNLRYNIILKPEPEGGFTVTVPALPGCVTYGKNINEARKMAREAIQLYLEDMIAEGETVPTDDDTYIGDIEITLPSSRRSLIRV